MAKTRAGSFKGTGASKQSAAQRAKSIVSRTMTVFPDLAQHLAECSMTLQDYFEYMLISPSCQRGRRTVTSKDGGQKIMLPYLATTMYPNTFQSAASVSCGKVPKQSGRRKRATGTTGRKRTG